jgi:glycosyltransferase involved in cell wall biosynthesis
MGGISQYIVHLLPALAALDAHNRYVLLHSRKATRSYVPDGGNFGRKTIYTPPHHRLERWTLSAEVARHRLDVLHSPDFIPPAFGARRRVVTVHDLNFLYYPHYLTDESRRYYNGQIKRAVREADAISADSEHTRQDLIDQLNVPPHKVTTIHLAPNPLYAEPVSADAVSATLAAHQLPRGYILFVGTLEPRKNIPTLLHAYRRLRHEAGVDVPLVLVGRTGWLADDIFATIDALNLRDCVRHLSGIYDTALAHLYHGAALLALPSHYEGFGLPPLEAMHCGCPVIASNRGSLPEVVGDGGLLLDADDVAAWADAMNRVLHDAALRERLIASGHAQARTFSWRRCAEQTLKLYEGGA